MRTLATYKNEGYEGLDVSLAISLFEYGLIWKEDKATGDYLCVYGVETDEGQYRLFDCAQLSLSDLAESSWIDWEGLRNYAGEDILEAIKANDPTALHSLMFYYGYDNVFGASYNTFTIAEEA